MRAIPNPVHHLLTLWVGNTIMPALQRICTGRLVCVQHKLSGQSVSQRGAVVSLVGNVARHILRQVSYHVVYLGDAFSTHTRTTETQTHIFFTRV